MAMKSGPLIGPAQYREYIFPHMKRLVEFFKAHGTKYVVVDSDGNTEPLIPLLMEAGVDGIWPIERASESMDPLEIRKKYGKDLRIWGGVDKRELAKDRKAIDEHLRSLAPLIEDGGFIPTVDHVVPPDVSYDNFCHYMERKMELLKGEWR
jgi:uroporphyrinogen decarboxylase